ncbi:MAG: ABC transporter permease subunit [Kiritimatiellaeota bacterium]|nr:ABC transporter permease subunit [Kiritimatiellota bacterium]
MIFPPIPYGPNEIIDPGDIQLPDVVLLRLIPELRVGRLNVAPDLTIVRAESAASFFGKERDIAVRGLSLADYWVLPDALRAAVKLRLRNRAAPRFATICRGRLVPEPVEFRLSAFRPRRRRPTSVRIVLREVPSNRLEPVKIAFDPGGIPRGHRALSRWRQLSHDVRNTLAQHVEERFSTLVEDRRVSIGGRVWRAVFDREEVRYPFRPVIGHWFGIDSAGRDVLARVLYGLRTSLTFGLLLVACSMGIGVFFGAIQGYFGGLLDITCQRLIEIWAALPFLYVMILLGSVYGRSFLLLIVCYGLFNWIGISYYVRAEFLRLRHLPFVEAARCLGLPARKIIFRHILPNALVPVITFFPFSLVGAIGSLAALDYLGFGLPPPTASWGELLQQAQQFRWAWWLILYPSLALFVVMLLGVFIGEGVRNAYDPRRYSRME